jgi:hypothetical protein
MFASFLHSYWAVSQRPAQPVPPGSRRLLHLRSQAPPPLPHRGPVPLVHLCLHQTCHGNRGELLDLPMPSIWSLPACLAEAPCTTAIEPPWLVWVFLRCACCSSRGQGSFAGSCWLCWCSPPRRSLAAGEMATDQPPSWPLATVGERRSPAGPARSVGPDKGEGGQGEIE